MLTIDLPWPPRALHPNARVHYLTKSSTARKYRSDCFFLTIDALKGTRPDFRAVDVHLEFSPPDSRHRDDDGMVAAFKNGRDGVADALRCNDRNWKTSHEVGEQVENGRVRLTITKSNGEST